MESNYKKVGHALSKESIVNPNTRGMGSQLKKMLGETDGSSLNKEKSAVNWLKNNSNPEVMFENTRPALDKPGLHNPPKPYNPSKLKEEGDIMDDTMNTLETESNVQGSDSQMINNQITAMKTGGVKGGFYKKGTDHDGDGDIDSEDYMESRNQAIKNNS